MKHVFFAVILFFFLSFVPENQGTSSILFWTAEELPAKIEVSLMRQDSSKVNQGKIEYLYKGVENPSCDHLNGLLFEKIPPGKYFFTAECYKPECEVCHGEGSYWQPIVHDDGTSSNQRGGKSKGNITGVWKTCTYCKGDGKAFYMSWTDVIEIGNYQCRTVLLK